MLLRNLAWGAGVQPRAGGETGERRRTKYQKWQSYRETRTQVLSTCTDALQARLIIFICQELNWTVDEVWPKKSLFNTDTYCMITKDDDNKWQKTLRRRLSNACWQCCSLFFVFLVLHASRCEGSCFQLIQLIADLISDTEQFKWGTWNLLVWSRPLPELTWDHHHHPLPVLRF